MDVTPTHAAPTHAAPMRPQVAHPQVPQQQVPGTTAAVPVAETALRQVLAGLGSSVDTEDSAAVALSLLRSVEALLRTSAPPGTSPSELGAAAAQLIERQGLVARLLSGSAAAPTPSTWAAAEYGAPTPSAIDTRL